MNYTESIRRSLYNVMQSRYPFIELVTCQIIFLLRLNIKNIWQYFHTNTQFSQGEHLKIKNQKIIFKIIR